MRKILLLLCAVSLCLPILASAGPKPGKKTTKKKKVKQKS